MNGWILYYKDSGIYVGGFNSIHEAASAKYRHPDSEKLDIMRENKYRKKYLTESAKLSALKLLMSKL